MKGQKCAILMLQLEVIHKLCLQEEGVGGQKKTNFVNIVCERPPILYLYYEESLVLSNF